MGVAGQTRPVTVSRRFPPVPDTEPDFHPCPVTARSYMQAQAVVFPQAHQVEFASVTVPDPNDDDIVVEVMQSWISNGTEGSYLRGERIAGDTAYRPGDPVPFPVVAGYQKVGRVSWVGANIRDVTPGEIVFAATGRIEGMFHGAGGQVSPSISNRESIWKLPADPDPLAFAGMVLTQVGYNCGTRAASRPGDGALVLGDGMVGHWAAQTLSLLGVRVMMLGRHADRLAKFPPAPTHFKVHEKEEDWPTVLAACFPEGLHILVDTVGSVTHLQAVLPFMVKHGQIVSAGFHGTDDRISLQDLRQRELSVHSVSGWTRERMDQTLRLIATGQLQTLPLITHRFPVQQAADAWNLIATRSEPVLGVILDWS